MKFRLISKRGNGLILMRRLADEGFTVDVWVKEPIDCGLPQALAWNNHLASDTIILFDYHGAGAIADTLKKNGFQIYGAGRLNDNMEGYFGQKLASTNMKVRKERMCKTFNETLEIFENDESLAFRPQKDGETHFCLREKISGPRLSIERFYMDGMAIPNTLNSKLESGNNVAVRFWKKATPKIYKLTLRPIEPFLLRFRYSGPLTCKVVINEKNHLPYFVEWVARFTFNGLAAFCEGLNQSIGQLIINILKKAPKQAVPSYKWFCSNGQAQCPDEDNQQRILKAMVADMNKLQKWRYL